jgi:hypothetical protein
MLLKIIELVLELLGKMPKIKYGSPPENELHQLFHNLGIMAIPQCNIPSLNRRVDFLIKENKIIIELDSFKWHSSKEKMIQDRYKDRIALAQGYLTIRLMATDLYNSDKLMAEVQAIVNTWRYYKHD